MKALVKTYFAYFVGALSVLFLVALSGIIIAKTGAIAFAIIPLIILCLGLGYYIFKNPYYGFLLIIFFLPFERVPTFNAGGVDIKINTILGFLTLFAWLLATLFNGKKWKIQPNVLSVPLTAFVIALLLSLTQAVNLSRAVQVLIFTLFTIALSIMTVNMIPDRESLKKVISVLFFSSLIVGLFGLFQFGGDVVGLPRAITLLKVGYDSSTFGFPRIQSFSMEPLYFANYLLIPLSLALAYYVSRVQMMKRWWLIGLLTLLLVNFVLTVSRGGYLGLLATLLIFAIFYFRKVFTWRNFALVLVLLAVAWGVAFALSKGETRATSEFVKHVTLGDAKKGSESVQGRLSAFSGAFQIYQRYPVLGIGLANYGPYVRHYPAVRPSTGWDIVNNEFIEILAETGILGAVTFGILLLVLLWRSLMALKRTNDPFLRATLFGLFAALIGILVQYNFFSTLYIIHIWVLIGLLVAVQNLVFRSHPA